MTCLIREMAASAGFETPFSDTTGLFANRQKFSKTIHVDNTIESLSILCLVHDNDFMTTVDWLHEHFDRENCPNENWDWLGCVYEDIFIDSLGRWATIVITATSRKSISDSLIRDDRIRGAADDMLRRYKEEEESMRFVTPSTHCPSAHPFQQIDIHYEVGVHLSPLLFHVLKFQKWFDLKLSEEMPLTLVIEFIYAFFSTNNTYRFHLEMVDFYKSIDESGTRILIDGFIFPYFTNIIRKYGSLDGLESRQGLREGSVRFQTCNGSMVTDGTVLQNLRQVYQIVKSTQDVRATLAVFKRVVRSIEKAMHGNGLLCSQKVIYSLSFLGIIDRSFLKYCLPGSKEHFKRLKETQFSFDTIDQVQQLVDAISSIGDEKGPIPAPKAEEIVCKLLKPPGTQYKDCVIRGVDLFWATTSPLSDITVSRLQYHTSSSGVLNPTRFGATDCTNYHPQWGQVQSPMDFAGLAVRFGSDKNKVFTVCEKVSSVARTHLLDESILACKDDFSFTEVQRLLNKNRTLFLSDPIGVIVDSFGLDRKCFCDSIRTKKTTDGHGWLSMLNPVVFKNTTLVHPFRQIHQVEVCRRSNFDVVENTPSNVSY